MIEQGQSQKLISVITPVYNGESYIADCIESVLAQTRGDFEYVIADNCSTDQSLAIAQRYAASDDRIRIVQADEHVGPVQNWNRSLKYASDEVRYIKFVHADDWLYPECLEKMVALAERDIRIAIVSAYRLEEYRVSLDRLPEFCQEQAMNREMILDGIDVGKAIFLEYASVLGSPTSVLYRKSAMEPLTNFFDESLLHADKDASLRLLAGHRLGFIRQVLTYTRRHNESVTSLTNMLDTRRQDDLQMLVRHGKTFLTDAELKTALRKTERLYYAFLARSLFSRQGDKFWTSHRQNLERAGISYSRWRIAAALGRQLLDPLRMIRRIRLVTRSGRDSHADSANNFIASNRRPRESDS